MPRYRATQHCQACAYYARLGSIRRRHVCTSYGNLPMVPMSYDEARTSPRWCPLGHVIYGVPFPAFRPGVDPVYIDPLEAALRSFLQSATDRDATGP